MKIGLLNRPGTIKDIDAGKHIVVSYPSTFGVVDAGRPPDSVERGAFKQTIGSWGPAGKNRIKALYQHDPTWLVGKPLSLTEDSIGLLAETQFSETAISRDVFTLIQDGVITEQSIGFDIIKEDFDSEGIRHLRELRLYEYSYVTWGMNEFTPIVSVKSSEVRAQLEQRISRLEKALKDGRFDSDEIPHAITIALATIKESLPDLSGIDLSDLANAPVIDVTDEDAVEQWMEAHSRHVNKWLGSVKEGRVLSARNRRLIEDAIEALMALMDAVEPGKATRRNNEPPKSDEAIANSARALLDSIRTTGKSEADVEATRKTLQAFAESLKG